MSSRESRTTLDPEALAAVGKLRECVAAARNLEHLVASRDVGPKLLEQVVPEVAAELMPFQNAIVEASSFVIKQLDLDAGALEALVQAGQQYARALSRGLGEDAGTPMNAKRRLFIERVIRDSLPMLSACLGQMELLIEATSSEGVPMSAHELLTSTPEVGSNRPHRRVVVHGAATELSIQTPARIGLRCLGIVAAAIDPNGSTPLCLEVREKAGFAEFRVTEVAPNGEFSTTKLPMYPHTKHSLSTAAAALKRYGGKLDETGRAVLLPLVT